MRVAEGDPETRGTSCAIPSWNVPKSIFRNRSRCKSVTKSRSRRKSVTKSGVSSVLLSLLVGAVWEGGFAFKVQNWFLKIGITEKVSPKVVLINQKVSPNDNDWFFSIDFTFKNTKKCHQIWMVDKKKMSLINNNWRGGRKRVWPRWTPNPKHKLRDYFLKCSEIDFLKLEKCKKCHQKYRLINRSMKKYTKNIASMRSQ